MTPRELFLCTAMTAALALLSIQTAAQGRSGQSAEFVPNQVLVQFRGDAPADAHDFARARVNGVREEITVAADRRNDGKGDLELVRIPPGLSVAAAVRELQQDSAVAFAEPNYIYRHQGSNDPYYNSGVLWGMYGDGTTPANQYGSQAGEAWASGTVGRADVHVAVIDEGIMGTHKDLKDNMWTNISEPKNGVDDDLNGLVDDVTGWDFENNDNTTYDGLYDDHGTHVAGTIGAVGNNGMGVVGVNWDVTLIPVKFLGLSGGTTANAIKALDYATNLKRRGLNLVATNNSWGGGGFSQALLDAITRGCDENILFVAAAGNASADNDSAPFYPASYSATCLISVAAITSSGARASFSNYGATTVHLGAPGSGIISTMTYRKKPVYDSYSGTSMATPHVTGAAALYKSKYSTATAAQIKKAILDAALATSTASLNGTTVTGGRLNVGLLVSQPPQ